MGYSNVDGNMKSTLSCRLTQCVAGSPAVAQAPSTGCKQLVVGLGYGLHSATCRALCISGHVTTFGEGSRRQEGHHHYTQFARCCDSSMHFDLSVKFKPPQSEHADRLLCVVRKLTQEHEVRAASSHGTMRNLRKCPSDSDARVRQGRANPCGFAVRHFLYCQLNPQCSPTSK